jgi:hypothetical protein
MVNEGVVSMLNMGHGIASGRIIIVWYKKKFIIGTAPLAINILVKYIILL